MNQVNLSISLDRDGEEPIYRQLIRHVRMQIESGNLPAGSRLPASRDLARQLNISRISVVNAYAELRAQGFLSAHAGRGTFVAGDNPGNGSNGNGNENPALDETPSTPDRSMREMMRLAQQPGVISFSHGALSADFFPVHQLRDAMDNVLERDGARALGYEPTEGYGPLRSAIRDYVSALGVQCSADQVLVTGGAQQGIDLVVQALLSEGDIVVTENPTYLGMIDIVRARRVQVHGIGMDQDGMRLDDLEHFIIDNNPRLIYVMPSFHNPTGNVMPLHRRRQLLNIANEYKVPVLEDGVYHEFRFEGESVPPLKALDDTGVVIHVSAFTKMMLPGLRIGYLISDARHYERLVRVKQAADIATPGLNQRAIHLMLQRGLLSQQLERNNRELRRRRDIALAAAERHLPPGSCWKVPEGGPFLWVRLPKNGPSAAELYIAAIQHGVAYAMGNVFYTDGCGSYRIRLNYGMQPPEQIDEGFRRLGRAWRELVCDYETIDKSMLL
jgi:2-aminoadipate transaminase